MSPLARPGPFDLDGGVDPGTLKWDRNGLVVGVVQDVADGRGDLALGQDARGHLVQQRLEEMMVRAVDDGDAHRFALERPRGEEPAEATADDHHVVAAVGRQGRAHRNRATTSST